MYGAFYYGDRREYGRGVSKAMRPNMYVVSWDRQLSMPRYLVIRKVSHYIILTLLQGFSSLSVGRSLSLPRMCGYFSGIFFNPGNTPGHFAL